MNTICINSFRYNLITCARLRLKAMWRLTKTKTKMKREHWTKRWNWSSCTNLALRATWTHGLIAQLVGASKRNSVVMGSNPTRTNFLYLLLKILQWWIPHLSIHSTTTWLAVRDFASSKCGDWREQRLKWNMNTEKRDEIGVALQSWLWERLELMAW